MTTHLESQSGETQSGGGKERRSPIRGRGERNSYRFESCPDYTVLATITE